ncbi:MAG: shikimate dehydrogenase [Gammaproteobacteria bacterium]|nr:shikimate dehydrogenase [Gammaproteobacteria bacterium]MCY4228752.1 shikimate dehydrogenase [Gammaproteobacteria bacterium]MCY4312477.1 shikimate dehydrogenase [Gammaproteobacteria bacterium]
MNDLFDFKPKAIRFAVMGNPIEHSRSPDIHREFALQTGINLEYDRIQVDGGFDQAVSHFQASNGAGLNITVPFKVDAWKLCARSGNELSARADVARAVNTLRFQENGTIYGDNTDGIGLVADLRQNLGLTIEGSSILLIGAGGAVRGILEPLLECRPARLDLTNRTMSKASDMAALFGEKVTPVTLQETGRRQYDLVINGTAAGLQGQVPELNPHCMNSNTLAYDMTYGPKLTPFMEWALDNGSYAVHDGLGMLVEQAAASFCLWHGVHPQTKPVIELISKIHHVRST